MGRMKEYYMDIMDYAEECCGSTLYREEAWRLFESIYPDEDEIFEEAWRNWDSFSQFILTHH
jgi:hypothetical protein